MYPNILKEWKKKKAINETENTCSRRFPVV